MLHPTPETTDVLLLAAGYGKRLMPLTERTPKPMLPLAGRPIIDYSLDLIARSGFRRVFINLHHLGERIREHIRDGSAFGLSVEYSEEPVLLDTGGAIKNLEPRIQSEHLVTVNSDTLFDPKFSLRTVLDAHVASSYDTLATLVLRTDPDADRFGSIGVDAAGAIVEFLGKRCGAAATKTYMYTGAQVISRRLFQFMPASGSIFSITRDTYVKVLERGEKLQAMVFDGYWSDLGTPERLAEASKSAVQLFGAGRPHLSR